LWSLPFLLIVSVAIPLLAINSYRNIRVPQVELLGRTALNLNLLPVQLFVGGFAALASFRAKAPLA
jgi:hypothetical protein